MCLYPEDDSGATEIDCGERRARKGHRCDECGRKIEPGEKYRFWTSVGGELDGFLTMKMCSHCWATIDVGAEIAGCPRNWYWEQVFDLDPDDGGFIGDIIANHDLTRRQTAFMRLLAYRGKRHWHAPNGDLYPIPSAA